MVIKPSVKFPSNKLKVSTIVTDEPLRKLEEAKNKNKQHTLSETTRTRRRLLRDASQFARNLLDMLNDADMDDPEIYDAD